MDSVIQPLNNRGQDSEEIDEFLDSMKKCFDDVDQALADENASIPLDYLESRPEDHFQIVNYGAPFVKKWFSLILQFFSLFTKLSFVIWYHKLWFDIINYYIKS